MEEEHSGGFVLFGGGFSVLLSIGALVLALNNPTAQDFKDEAASIIRQEAADTNPLLALMSEEIGRAGADALTIRYTNYIVLTHLEVTTPDARIFGGEAPQQFCFIGIMNKFYPCPALTADERQASTPKNVGSTQAFSGSLSREQVQAEARSAREIHLARGFRDHGNESIDRPKGWICDGTRVTFASAGAGFVDEEGRPSDFGQGILFLPYIVSIAGQKSKWLLDQSNCGASCNEDNPVYQYLTPLPNSSFRDAEFSFQFGLNFNNRPCEPVK